MWVWILAFWISDFEFQISDFRFPLLPHYHQAAVSASGAATAKDFGKVMPLVMKELKGKADGKLVQEIVKRTLGM